jgi:hypothetical protein
VPASRARPRCSPRPRPAVRTEPTARDCCRVRERAREPLLLDQVVHVRPAQSHLLQDVTQAEQPLAQHHAGSRHETRRGCAVVVGGELAATRALAKCLDGRGRDDTRSRLGARHGHASERTRSWRMSCGYRRRRHVSVGEIERPDGDRARTVRNPIPSSDLARGHARLFVGTNSPFETVSRCPLPAARPDRRLGSTRSRTGIAAPRALRARCAATGGGRTGRAWARVGLIRVSGRGDYAV